MAKSYRVTIRKSSVNGRIVSTRFADAHPKTTYKTTITRKSGK